MLSEIWLYIWHLNIVFSDQWVLSCTAAVRLFQKAGPHIQQTSCTRFSNKQESLTRHQTSSTVCFHLYSDGSSICYFTIILNFDLLTPKFNCLSLSHNTSLCKFGENSTNTFQDIVSTSQESAVSSILHSTVTLTSDLLTPKMVKMCQTLCTILS